MKHHTFLSLTEVALAMLGHKLRHPESQFVPLDSEDGIGFKDTVTQMTWELDKDAPPTDVRSEFLYNFGTHGVPKVAQQMTEGTFDPLTLKEVPCQEPHLFNNYKVLLLNVQMFRNTHPKVRIICDDDPMTRRLGFIDLISGTRWQIPLTRLMVDTDIPDRELLRTAEGSAKIAKHLNDGTLDPSWLAGMPD